MPKAAGADERTDLDAGRRFSQRAHDGPGLPGAARRVVVEAPVCAGSENQVVRHEERVEADLFGELCELAQLGIARQPARPAQRLDGRQEQSKAQ